MKTTEVNELLEEIKNDIPNTFWFLRKDIKKYIDWTILINQVEEEVRCKLIEMEIATSPATIWEIKQVEEEWKHLVELLLESDL